MKTVQEAIDNVFGKTRYKREWNEKIQRDVAFKSVTEDPWGQRHWVRLVEIIQNEDFPDVHRLGINRINERLYELSRCEIDKTIEFGRVDSLASSVCNYFNMYCNDAKHYEHEREKLMNEPDLSIIMQFLFCYNVRVNKKVPNCVWYVLWWSDEKDERFQSIREELEFCAVSFLFGQ